MSHIGGHERMNGGTNGRVRNGGLAGRSTCRWRPSDDGNNILEAIQPETSLPCKREDVIKWSGWGYKECQWIVNDEGIPVFSGDKYNICNRNLEKFMEWVEQKFGLKISTEQARVPVDIPPDYHMPATRATAEQLAVLTKLGVKMSVQGSDRLIRSHGQCLHEIMDIINNTVERIPDVVVWPTCHDDVVRIVRAASENDMVIIPIGGATSVTGAVQCPAAENRTIISLDTSKMNKILWIDKESLVACVECGIVGQDLEKALEEQGYIFGHQPDSVEFSTLGGWIATRASGMKKNMYGNIEDLVLSSRLVTPSGVLEKSCRVPRQSCGPDLQQLVLGSEGCLGVVTEACIRIRPYPEETRYDSFVFPDFDSGMGFVREVAMKRLQPASFRLMDNEQYQLSNALRSGSTYVDGVKESLKQFYLGTLKGIDTAKMAVATIVYEGDLEAVVFQEGKINQIAAKHGAIRGGASAGKNGYDTTFVIAYLRDIALEIGIYAESVETSVPWDRAALVMRTVDRVISEEAARLGVRHFYNMSRVAQVYDSGCCLYFYFAFNGKEVQNPTSVSVAFEKAARDEIIALGGTISHHHGVGKTRRSWFKNMVSETGVGLLQAAKRQLDPDNVFAVSNLMEDELAASGADS